ncbi:large proline-rich protein bag6-A isoform X2 [Sitophilus oryzae]|uniref:Large proline-rich protein BAG6 n=1 Tax=Sitophilus oryzae TaxID=7048 RepID=A0A6J2XH09_SITOR|nr:large proline-rich protein bag6-A isoform X2 [Sitophilus oryzae]
MINVTVKTLDSQNHEFSVEDAITVEQFKREIESVVNIAADRQRIIYCGRVLQDTSKLKDYDVDGKVVHLVQRAPPSAANRHGRSVTPPPDFNRSQGPFRAFDRIGNTVYMGMGSMTFPQGHIIDPQQMIPPRATHTLIASRLNVARRMLRNAENIIRRLENPTSSTEQAPEEQPEEEMTPVIEARVIVPTNGDQPIDETVIANAVENTIFSEGVSNSQATTSNNTTSNENNEASSEQQSSTSVPDASAPRPSSAETSNSENNTDSSQQQNENTARRSRAPEMAELLTTLNQLQVRFAPFLARYQAFMQEDPQVPQENVQQTHEMLNRVSQVLHLLGHAYHSLSDIMINVEQPPPRLLYCRPILIQHSAVVQAGIPIQVEAQINLSADRAGVSSTTPASNATSGATAGATNTNSAPNATASTGSTTGLLSGPSITVQPGFVEVPFMPPGSMRVITAPLEIRTVRARSRPPNNNNNQTPNATTANSAPSSTVPNPTPPASQAPPPAPPTNQPGQTPQTGPMQGNPFGPNNGNLEFFMEVTPEVLRSGNLIHSLMQLVGSQLGGGLGQAAQAAQSQGQPTSTTTTDSSQASQGANGQAPNNSQSQARGNTQTNPTTATHTRSTPRPHVQMTQQAVQGGFDPFLPCYSHHVTHARGQRIIPMNQANRAESAASRDAASAQTSSTSTQTNQQRNSNAPPNLANLAAQFENVVRGFPAPFAQIPNFMEQNPQMFQSIAEVLSNVMRTDMHQQAAPQTPPQRGAPDGQGAPSPQPGTRNPINVRAGLLSGLFARNNGEEPTLDHYMQSLYPNSYVQGENTVSDFIMLMLRNLRVATDLSMLSNGNMAPLERQADAVRRFFTTEICGNDTSDIGIEHATERMASDFRSVIAALDVVRFRDDIDSTRTLENFFRQKLSTLIRVAVNSGTQSDGQNNANRGTFVTVVWRAVKELLALVLHCSLNGQQGVEEATEVYLANVNPALWEFVSGARTELLSAIRNMIRTSDVRAGDIQQYVIRKTQEPVNSRTLVNETAAMPRSHDVEAMDVDFANSPTGAEQPMVDSAMKVENTEPLPNVVWGSEPWHRHTPEEWVPIITRDVPRQRRQNSQAPFSDAYLAGMPSKRRKLINQPKIEGNFSQVISETVREAVTATGLTSAAPLDTVAEAAGQSVEIQTAFSSLLRSTVHANLRDNEDFTPDRFPNTANYFNGTPPE